MKPLGILEEKIAQLVALMNQLKAQNGKLVEENSQLEKVIQTLESSVKQDGKVLDKLHEETEATKAVVDDLIKNINALVSNEVQP